MFNVLAYKQWKKINNDDEGWSTASDPTSLRYKLNVTRPISMNYTYSYWAFSGTSSGNFMTAMSNKNVTGWTVSTIGDYKYSLISTPIGGYMFWIGHA